jgi:hypothetical protein
VRITPDPPAAVPPHGATARALRSPLREAKEGHPPA